MCVCEHTCVCHLSHSVWKLEDNFCEINSSIPPSSWFQGLSSGPQACVASAFTNCQPQGKVCCINSVSFYKSCLHSLPPSFNTSVLRQNPLAPTVQFSGAPCDLNRGVASHFQQYLYYTKVPKMILEYFTNLYEK